MERNQPLMYSIQQRLQKDLEEIKANGLYKAERIITTPQGAEIKTTTPKSPKGDLKDKIQIRLLAVKSPLGDLGVDVI